MVTFANNEDGILCPDVNVPARPWLIEDLKISRLPKTSELFTQAGRQALIDLKREAHAQPGICEECKDGAQYTRSCPDWKQCHR